MSRRRVFKVDYGLCTLTEVESTSDYEILLNSGSYFSTKEQAWKELHKHWQSSMDLYHRLFEEAQGKFQKAGIELLRSKS